MSIVAPCKCHRRMWYTSPTQSCIKAKSSADLLDISGKSTVRNYHCHLLPSSLELQLPWIYAHRQKRVDLHVSGKRSWYRRWMTTKRWKWSQKCNRWKRWQKQWNVFFMFKSFVCVFMFHPNPVCVCVSNLCHASIQLTALQVCMPATAGHKVTLSFYGCSPWCFT